MVPWAGSQRRLRKHPGLYAYRETDSPLQPERTSKRRTDDINERFFERRSEELKASRVSSVGNYSTTSMNDSDRRREYLSFFMPSMMISNYILRFESLYSRHGSAFSVKHTYKHTYTYTLTQKKNGYEEDRSNQREAGKYVAVWILEAVLFRKSKLSCLLLRVGRDVCAIPKTQKRNRKRQSN